MMKFCILGAGSVGCYAGGCLQAGGGEVIFLGRDSMAATIRDHGLKVTDHEGRDSTVSPEEIRFETGAECLQDADVILVCVKSQDTAEAASLIDQFARSDALVISLQNGVTNAAELRAGVGERAVAGGMVPYNVVNLGQGHFHRGTAGRLIVEETTATTAVARWMSECGLPTIVSSDIDGVLWGKLLINLNNALNLLSDKPLRQQLLDINFRRVWGLCIKEGLAALKSAGIKPSKAGNLDAEHFARILGLPNFILLRVAKGFSQVDEKARSSMWEDLQAGRSPEIDFINGAIVKLGAENGVLTPVNSKIVELVRAAFAAGKSPAFSGKELWQIIREL